MKCWHAIKVEQLAGDEVCLIKLQGFGQEEDHCLYVRDSLQSVSGLFRVI